MIKDNSIRNDVYFLMKTLTSTFSKKLTTISTTSTKLQVLQKCILVSNNAINNIEYEDH